MHPEYILPCRVLAGFVHTGPDKLAINAQNLPTPAIETQPQLIYKE